MGETEILSRVMASIDSTPTACTRTPRGRGPRGGTSTFHSTLSLELNPKFIRGLFLREASSLPQSN